MANVSSFSGAMPVIPGGEVEVARVSRTNLTSGLSVTATSVAATSDFFVTSATFVADGFSSYIVRLHVPLVYSMTNAAYSSRLSLTSGSTEVARLFIQDTTAAFNGTSADVACVVVPSAGAVSYNVRPWVTANTTNIYCGPGGANYAPAVLSVSKIVNQNDGLKPFWTPPIVTQLPSQATVGDQVIFAADATNGVYWHLTYDGLGTYPWKYIGGPSLFNVVETDQAVTPATGYTWSDLATVGPSVTLPLAGDYDVAWGARMWNNTNAGSPLMAISFDGAAPVFSSEAMWPYNNGTGVAVAPGGAWQGSRFIRRTVTTSGQIARAKYSSASGGTTSNFQSRWLTAAPVRVKAA
jgi:hypothetical protein